MPLKRKPEQQISGRTKREQEKVHAQAKRAQLFGGGASTANQQQQQSQQQQQHPPKFVFSTPSSTFVTSSSSSSNNTKQQEENSNNCFPASYMSFGTIQNVATNEIRSIAVSNDNQFLVCGSQDETITCFRFSENSPSKVEFIKRFRTDHRVAILKFHPKNSHVFASSGNQMLVKSRNVFLWSIDKQQGDDDEGEDENQEGENEQEEGTNNNDNSYEKHLFGQPVELPQDCGYVTSFEFSQHDGGKFLIVGALDGTMRMFNLLSEDRELCFQSLRHSDAIRSISFAPPFSLGGGGGGNNRGNGSLFLTASKDKKVSFYLLDSYSETVHELPQHIPSSAFGTFSKLLSVNSCCFVSPAPKHEILIPSSTKQLPGPCEVQISFDFASGLASEEGPIIVDTICLYYKMKKSVSHELKQHLIDQSTQNTNLFFDSEEDEDEEEEENEKETKKKKRRNQTAASAGSFQDHSSSKIKKPNRVAFTTSTLNTEKKIFISGKNFGLTKKASMQDPGECLQVVSTPIPKSLLLLHSQKSNQQKKVGGENKDQIPFRRSQIFSFFSSEKYVCCIDLDSFDSIQRENLQQVKQQQQKQKQQQQQASAKVAAAVTTTTSVGGNSDDDEDEKSRKLSAFRKYATVVNFGDFPNSIALSANARFLLVGGDKRSKDLKILWNPNVQRRFKKLKPLLLIWKKGKGALHLLFENEFAPLRLSAKFFM